jgi:hypothetical protein
MSRLILLILSIPEAARDGRCDRHALLLVQLKLAVPAYAEMARADR